MKRVAIVQSNYIPWKGYFDLIAAVDEFILFDDVQFTRRDWRNRNLIKTPDGPKWLTIPVQVKGRYLQSIRETMIGDTGWPQQHWRSIALNYGRAPFFRETAEWLEPLYQAATFPDLSGVNRHFLRAICDRLGIATPLGSSSDHVLEGDPSERLASICAQAGAGVYLSGPAARAYLDEGAFARRGIEVRWFDYEGYRPYPQLWGPFDHKLSLLDLIFNTGPEARSFMKVSR
jgi:hypothetical protein